MAATTPYAFVFFLSLCLIALLPPALARPPTYQRQLPQNGQPLRHGCDIQQLNASEPTHQIKAEAGVIEVWEPNDKQFHCTGVTVLRYVIEPAGLLLPIFTNAPTINTVVQGRGIIGVNIPGVAGVFAGVGAGSRVLEVGEDDVIGLPAGAVQCIYNNGNNSLVVLALAVTGVCSSGQCDLHFRGFNLVMNREGQNGQEQGLEDVTFQNILGSLDNELLADAFNVDIETIGSLQAGNNKRGIIIQVEGGLEILSHEWNEKEEESMRRFYGLKEETLSFICNIHQPLHADVVTENGGRINTLNGQKFPLIQYLQLSVEKGVLYKNALMTPHLNINAHSIMYVTQGTGRVQVVGENGVLVFDDRVQEGQLLVVPQNFVVVKKAEQGGLEWVAFKTNANAIISPLVGKRSAIQGMPEEVLMNSYNLSRDEVRRLKSGRKELIMFSPKLD